jgi:hypothetical protein
MNITFCEPATSNVLPDPQFHNPQRHAPVGAHAVAGGQTVSTGIDFADYSRMAVHTRGAATYRQKPTPEYALDHNKMRALLVRFLEARAFSRKQIAAGLPGSDATRLQRAQEKLAADRPRLITLADKLCKEYVDGKNYGAPKERLQQLEVEIEGIDTQLRMQAENFPAVVLGVIYRSYCLGDNSVAVAAALGMKPPAVRQLLARLARTWKQMQTEQAAPTVAGRLRRTPLNRLVAARTKSAEWFANLTPQEKEERRARVNKTTAEWIAEHKKDPVWCDMRTADDRARARIARSIAKENTRRARVTAR